jgi:hypothetical protein
MPLSAQVARSARRLRAGSAAERRRVLQDLEDLACGDDLSPLDRKVLAWVLLSRFHLWPLPERRAAAAFLETWFTTETSARLSRRLEATRLEETDPETRESLKVAVYATLPAPELVRSIAEPSEEDLTVGLGLLMALETALTRLRQGAFDRRQIPALVDALRKARAHRASHIAKPFLWRLEHVLETAMRVGAYLLR